MSSTSWDHSSPDFWRRHIGVTPTEFDTMLAAVGVATMDELIDKAVPESIRIRDDLDIPAARTEPEVAEALRRLGEKNDVYISLLGRATTARTLRR